MVFARSSKGRQTTEEPSSASDQACLVRGGKLETSHCQDPIVGSRPSAGCAPESSHSKDHAVKQPDLLINAKRLHPAAEDGRPPSRLH